MDRRTDRGTYFHIAMHIDGQTDGRTCKQTPDLQADRYIFEHIYVGSKAALLFWFFGDFRSGALLFMVIHVIYKCKNR